MNRQCQPVGAGSRDSGERCDSLDLSYETSCIELSSVVEGTLDRSLDV